MKLLLLLSLIVAKGSCTCNSSSSTVGNNVCYMGTCIENQCVCFDGWGGEKCNTCIGRVKLTNSSGYITDGPDNYSRLSKCSWLIEPKNRNSSLRLRFNEFATECGWDHLYVYDGDSVFSPLIGAFNGILHTNGLNSTPPEVIAKSGKAFLHFYSDLAYNMIGFNISYTVDECLYDCFDRGSCTPNGTCECNTNYSGEKCNLCDCSGATFQCVDDPNVCSNAEQTWSIVEFDESSLTPRGSFSVSDVDSAGTRWLYGGYSFDVRFLDHLYSFDTNQNSWTLRAPLNSNSSAPRARYEHSTVVWNNSLLVFGGKLVENETTVNELWEYSIASGDWSLVEYEVGFSQALSTDSKSNLKLAGHSADLVSFSNGTEIMVVTFGHQPNAGFSPFVYEYDPSRKIWSLSLTGGAIVKGLFGHTTVYDNTTRMIYIHGGLHLTGQLRKDAFSTDQTLSYNPETREFSMLASSGHFRFLHSASIFDGVMYVYGGSVQTSFSSNSSVGTPCYLSDFMAYYIECDRWATLPSPPGTVQKDRYGQGSAFVRRSNQNQLHVISGFDSTMISNTLIYRIPNCSYFESEASCESSYTRGVLCSWNGSCVSSSPSSCSFLPDQPVCPSFDSLPSVNCESHSDCKRCNGSCAPLSDVCSQNQTETETESEAYCKNLHNCLLCESSPSDLCKWDSGGCMVRNGSSNSSTCIAYHDCETAATCDACNKNNDCMWCRNVEKCVASKAYVIQFPYGQCQEWTNKKPCVSYDCSSYDTCSECQNHSRCGWCDDGSSTGLGTCMDGSGSGPVAPDQQGFAVLNDLCPSPQWFFIDCPLCQCNGHSTCDLDNNTCLNCTNNTTGSNCEVCADGFFGNALNGGTCSPCECGDKAVTCDPHSGACRCSTKGQSGLSCEDCDTGKGYVGNATGNGTCYYNLEENYIFTFNLVDPYITTINFRNQPGSWEDVSLSWSASVPCNVRLAVAFNATDSFEEEQTVNYYEGVTSIDFTFRSSKYEFGPDQLNTIIRIYVTQLIVPVQVKVSLIQYNNAILKLLLALFSALLAILIIAAVVWKLKMIYDNRQRRAMRAVQLKEMAARPFAGVSLHCDDIYRSTQSLLSPTYTPYTLLEANQTPDFFCEEKCGGGDASVASVFLWLPSNVPCDKAKGENDSTSSRNSDSNCYLSPPPGQASLAIGSVLVSTKNLQNNCNSARSSTPSSGQSSPGKATDNRASGDAFVSI